MTILRTLRHFLMVLALASLLAACASTPPPSSYTSDSGMSNGQDQQVAATDVSQEPDVMGVDQGSMTSQGVADHVTVQGLERIHFDFDQFTLTEEARETLKQNADYLRANPDVDVVIEGHTDERGSDEYNLALGERRASAGKQYLVSLGISGDRLSIISYGEEMPLIDQSNDSAYSQNRRAEFKAVR